MPRSNLFSVDWFKENKRSQERTFEEIAQPVNEELDLLEAKATYDLNRSIAQAAYYLWLERQKHSHPGGALGDWLQAEEKLRETAEK